MVPVYFDESAKYASSAVTRLRRSDFIAVTYAFDLVLANFGIAIAARIPMITTTMRSSISVKPLRFLSMVNIPWLKGSLEDDVVGSFGRHRSNGRTNQAEHVQDEQHQQLS